MMDEVDRELLDLFDAARSATRPTRADRARIARALSAHIAALAVVSSSAKTALAATGTPGGVLGQGLKLVLLTQVVPSLLAGTVLGGGAAWLASTATETAVEPAPPAAAAVTAGSESRAPPALSRSSRAATREDEPVAPPASASHERAVHAQPRTSPPPIPSACEGTSCASAPGARLPARVAGTDSETSELWGELAVVSRLHRAWQGGDRATAQQLVREHERRFPHGTLTEERDAIQTMLACGRATASQAGDLAATFAAKYPRSTHAARVGAACAAKKP